MPTGSVGRAREDDGETDRPAELGTKTAQAAEAVKAQAADMAQRGVEKIDDTLAASAKIMESAAETIREQADVLPNGPTPRRLAYGTADVLESGADYIRTHDTKSMASDAWQFAKDHPIGSLAIAVVAGFLVGRAFWGD